MDEKIEQDEDELMNTKNILSIKKRKFSGKKTKLKSNNLNILIKMKYIYYPIIICIGFTLFILILRKLFKRAKNTNLIDLNIISENQTYSLNTEELIFDNISVSYEKAENYIKKNVEGVLLNKSNYLSENPKVSAIIPVYNSKDIILRSIRSIQNQNMKDIEIILVNDFSTDDTLSYIEELQKEDPRIIIIKNQKNMGTLYSRSIGALSAKGKYIFPLDNGDMFLDYDVFDTVYDVAIKDNFDIVEFRAINVPGLYNLSGNTLLNIMFSYHKLNLVLSQPELGYFPLQPKNETGQFSIIDNYLWNKCIKTSVYQKTLNLFGEERYKRHMTYHEDLIIVILIFNVAESFKFIGKYSVLNVPNSGSGERPLPIMNLYEMYLIDAMIDFSKDIKENKKIIVQYMITLLGRGELEETLKEDDNKKLFSSLLNRIYSCTLISEEDKNEIKKRSSRIQNLLDQI